MTNNELSDFLCADERKYHGMELTVKDKEVLGSGDGVQLDTYTGTYFIKRNGKVVAANFLTRREAAYYMNNKM